MWRESTKRLVEEKKPKPKATGKDNLWILQLLDNASLKAELNYRAEELLTRLRVKASAFCARAVSSCVEKPAAPPCQG